MTGCACPGRGSLLQCRPQGRESDICPVDQGRDEEGVGGTGGCHWDIFYFLNKCPPVTTYCASLFLPGGESISRNRPPSHWPGAKPVWQTEPILDEAWRDVWRPRDSNGAGHSGLFISREALCPLQAVHTGKSVAGTSKHTSAH